ncbi:hypothetical protein P12x_002629 [Tundrisphaera lichenicola]|uniref:hypothetical protein n=1 Tax=Tundrisphaera lichenicola TaxID=2029860 RepID=UPI003EBA9F12
MRLVPIAATAILAAIASACPAEDVDHPAYLSWAGHPIGTSVTLRTRTASKGRLLTTTITTTLKELKPDVAILESRKVSDATGTTVENAPEIVRINRKFPLLPGVKKEDIGKPRGASNQGEETIKVGEKEFKSVWFDSKSKGDGNLDLLTRTWMSDELPGRLVKSVTEIPTAETTVTTELIEFKAP